MDVPPLQLSPSPSHSLRFLLPLRKIMFRAMEGITEQQMFPLREEHRIILIRGALAQQLLLFQISQQEIIR